MSDTVKMSDDGLPLISVVDSYRRLNGDIWRVIYRCGRLRAQISILDGFCVLSATNIQGRTWEKRYKTFDRAYNGLLSLRRSAA